MTRKRGRFTAEFKVRVPVAAMKEDRTLAALASGRKRRDAASTLAGVCPRHPGSGGRWGGSRRHRTCFQVLLSVREPGGRFGERVCREAADRL